MKKISKMLRNMVMWLLYDTLMIHDIKLLEDVLNLERNVLLYSQVSSKCREVPHLRNSNGSEEQLNSFLS